MNLPTLPKGAVMAAIAACGAFVVVVMCLFPPWLDQGVWVYVRHEDGVSRLQWAPDVIPAMRSRMSYRRAGYGFVFAPGEDQDRLDTARLGVQIVATVAATLAALLGLHAVRRTSAPRTPANHER